MKLSTARAAILLAIVGPAYSWAGAATDTLITKLHINKSVGDMVFISVDKAKDSTPSCHINDNWAFVLSLTSDQDKKIYAMLLAARASQTPVSLFGSGTCDVFSAVESLGGMHY